MLVIKLTRNIAGLGKQGNLVIADDEKIPGAGSWCARICNGRVVFERFREGEPPDAVVVEVLE